MPRTVNIENIHKYRSGSWGAAPIEDAALISVITCLAQIKYWKYAQI